MALNIQRLNFDPVTGDNSSEAFMKLDLDIGVIAEAIDGDGTPENTGIDGRLAAVETVVDGLGNAATKDVGTSAGTVAAGNDQRFADNATAASNAQTTANAALPKAGGILTGQVQARSGFLTYGNPTFVSGGGNAFGWNGIISGASDYYCFNNGGSGGFIYRTLNINNTAIVGTFGFDPSGAILSAYSPIFKASADNATDLGSSAFRYKALFAVTGTIQTSDERTKNIIGPSSLGMELVDLLQPIAYTLKVARNDVHIVQSGTMEVPSVDADGRPVIDADGNQVMESRALYEEQCTPVAGTRIHLGFRAQGVAEALRTLGLEPAEYAMWTLDNPADPDSQQGLRHEQLIAVLTVALKQEKAARLVLEARVAALEAA